MGLVVFSHGKDSSPKAKKIEALEPVARSCGWRTLIPDYRGIDDPGQRVEVLKGLVADAEPGPLVFYGSSLGGLISVFASQKRSVQGLFLLAPAVYWPGYEHLDYVCQVPVIEVIHGWRDDIVSADQVLRWSREHFATLHLVDDDHLLLNYLPGIGVLFRSFLKRVEDEI